MGICCKKWQWSMKFYFKLYIINQVKYYFFYQIKLFINKYFTYLSYISYWIWTNENNKLFRLKFDFQ